MGYRRGGSRGRDEKGGREATIQKEGARATWWAKERPGESTETEGLKINKMSCGKRFRLFTKSFRIFFARLHLPRRLSVPLRGPRGGLFPFARRPLSLSLFLSSQFFSPLFLALPLPPPLPFSTITRFLLTSEVAQTFSRALQKLFYNRVGWNAYTRAYFATPTALMSDSVASSSTRVLLYNVYIFKKLL